MFFVQIKVAGSHSLAGFCLASFCSFLLCRAPKGRQEFQGWQDNQACPDYQELMYVYKKRKQIVSIILSTHHIQTVSSICLFSILEITVMMRSLFRVWRVLTVLLGRMDPQGKQWVCLSFDRSRLLRIMPRRTQLNCHDTPFLRLPPYLQTSLI